MDSMKNTPRNYSSLFDAFPADISDKAGSMLEKTGKVSFTVSFSAGTKAGIINDNSSILSTILVAILGIAFAVGLVTFITSGIHFAGRGKGKTNFLSSSAYMLKKVFKYLILPGIVITTLIVLFAILTNQPSFR